jgi:hypothetical protein
MPKTEAIQIGHKKPNGDFPKTTQITFIGFQYFMVIISTDKTAYVVSSGK